MWIMGFGNGEVIGDIKYWYGMVRTKALLEQIFNRSYILQNIFSALLKNSL